MFKKQEKSVSRAIETTNAEMKCPFHPNKRNITALATSKLELTQEEGEEKGMPQLTRTQRRNSVI